jgi:hypothetical protein
MMRNGEYDAAGRDVGEVLEKPDPGLFKIHVEYYIEYRGGKYPIKQVITSITSWSIFTAMDAYRF